MKATLESTVKEVREDRKVQHKNEIFVTQIVDLDEEFEGLSARLREKSRIM